MAKAVMDMPESCSMCKFLYEFQDIKKCQLMNVLNNGASRLSQNTFTEKRHEKCPLRELPEKKEELSVEEYEFGGLGKAFVSGWNACLDEILKEPQNEGGASKTNPTG